jgi:DNA primase
MKTLRFNDPLLMPITGESVEQRLANTVPLRRSCGQEYVERRGISVEFAEAAGVMFDANFNGRPAIVFPMRDQFGQLTSLHGRYLEARRGKNKMFTFGSGGGVGNVLKGWQAEPLILVEGLFDALSLACCGWASVATMGRWAPWLPSVSAGRAVWLAFDNGCPGEAEAMHYTHRLATSHVHRLPPPKRCKDWNTALIKFGSDSLDKWICNNLSASFSLTP